MAKRPRRTVGFVVPMEKEARRLIAALRSRRRRTLRGRPLITGTLGGRACAVLVSGTGKIRSAAGTQLLLDQVECDSVFHFGSGGALDPTLAIGDLVVASDIVEHDYIQKFGEREDHPIATTDPAGRRRFLAFAAKRGTVARAGRIVSGNEDVVTTTRRDELCQQFEGVSVDWESAGCAQVCNANRVPVVVIRAISDFAYEHTHDEYSQNAVDVCGRLAELLAAYLIAGASISRRVRSRR